ncbi:hypothetical protein QR680_008011 [Steinernema hermaphroditum]|uniref:Uncharacterized protein n=1 Tax=Steinernema hermaphroditum TaxID=289476 RepID=A0AA39IHG4_9BILA|nr:hypothetical protein QR680_008011 [Steinernema hermaphroditum]
MCSSLESYFKLATLSSFIFHFGLILIGGISLSSKWDLKLYYAIFPCFVVTTAIYTLLLPQAFESEKFEFSTYNKFLLYHIVAIDFIVLFPTSYFVFAGYDADILIGMLVSVFIQTGFLIFFFAYRKIKRQELEKSIYKDVKQLKKMQTTNL